METFFMNSKNSKTNEPNRFKYDLIDKLDLRNPNKNMALANLSIYYTWKNVKSTYDNKFKISAQTWNETFDLPDGSYNVSEIQDYYYFFNCYLVAPRPTSGHYRGDSLTHPMLITAFLHIRLEGHREPRSEVGSLSPAKRLVGFEPGTFRF